MSPSRERPARPGRHTPTPRPAGPRRVVVATAVAAVVVAAAGGVWLWHHPASAPALVQPWMPPDGSAPETTRATASPPATADRDGSAPDHPGPAPATPARAATATAPLSPAALAVRGQVDRLAALPPGDDAIALGRQLAAAATPDTAPAFRDALLQTASPAVERVAIAALARTADSAVVQDLARAYGDLPAERRGRVLQVLEGAGNPAALEGLVRIVDADTSEKRSPLTMSALYGLASLGTMDSVDYLLRQTRTDAIDHALMAMERVRTRQGVELIRAAAAGSKDHAQLAPDLQRHLGRIASVAEAQITP